MFRLQLRCSGGTSNLGVDAGLQGQRSSSLHANSLKVGALHVALALVLRRFAVVGTVFSSLVRGSGLHGPCRPSNEHEDGCPVALKTAYLIENRPASSTLKGLPDHHCEPPNKVLPPLKDPPGRQKRENGLCPVNLTLKEHKFHWVVKLILQQPKDSTHTQLTGPSGVWQALAVVLVPRGRGTICCQ